MVKLAREITIVIITDFGPEEILRRLSRAIKRTKLGLSEKQKAFDRLCMMNRMLIGRYFGAEEEI